LAEFIMFGTGYHTAPRFQSMGWTKIGPAKFKRSRAARASSAVLDTGMAPDHPLLNSSITRV
jgi:hypothetical protein